MEMGTYEGSKIIDDWHSTLSNCEMIYDDIYTTTMRGGVAKDLDDWVYQDREGNIELENEAKTIQMHNKTRNYPSGNSAFCGRGWSKHKSETRCERLRKGIGCGKR
jgi:hypothetical protein